MQRAFGTAGNTFSWLRFPMTEEHLSGGVLDLCVACNHDHASEETPRLVQVQNHVYAARNQAAPHDAPARAYQPLSIKTVE